MKHSKSEEGNELPNTRSSNDSNQNVFREAHTKTPYNQTAKSHRKRDNLERSKRKKQFITFKGAPIRLLVNFSAETLQAKREWDDIFKESNEKSQPSILYL